MDMVIPQPERKQQIESWLSDWKQKKRTAQRETDAAVKTESDTTDDVLW